MKNILITICGRAGSKGFKNKNLKTFAGYPLSHYSLSAAQLFIKSRGDLRVDMCLNTDSEPLVDVVRQMCPDITVLMRPEELCGDVVPKMPVYQNSLERMEKLNAIKYDYVIDLDITSPLRRDYDIDGALKVKEEKPQLDLIFSVTPSRRTPYMNMAKQVGDRVEKVIDHRNTARQQTPPVFDINASIYVFERDFLATNESGFVWDGACGMYEMMDTGIIDIDSEEDYLLMEAIAKHLYETNENFAAVQLAIKN